MGFRVSTLAFLVLAILAGAGWGYERARGAEIRHQLDSLRTVEDSLRDSVSVLAARQPGLDTIYVVKTRTLWRTRAATDSTLARDTIPVPRGEVRAILTVERAACDTVLGACEAQKANLTALAATQARQTANLRLQVGLEQKRRPGLFSGILTKLAWAGGGFLLGSALH
jgi:hypothetical protein